MRSLLYDTYLILQKPRVMSRFMLVISLYVCCNRLRAEVSTVDQVPFHSRFHLFELPLVLFEATEFSSSSHIGVLPVSFNVFKRVENLDLLLRMSAARAESTGFMVHVCPVQDLQILLHQPLFESLSLRIFLQF
jgi:hypothetical protein